MSDQRIEREGLGRIEGKDGRLEVLSEAPSVVASPVEVLAGERTTVGLMYAEPRSLDALAVLGARLQARHPAASPAMVHQSIEDAVRAFSTAPLRLYVPILIERAASEALREATRSREGLTSTPPTSTGPDL